MSVTAPTPTAVNRAAQVLREGGVVVMPTETVYGLACDALNVEAVRRVFEIKGRPSDNPLIVHVASIEQARLLTLRWSPEAETLARAFWPGPLTLVLPKAECVPNATTAGLATVALRMPRHHVCRSLIEAAGRALAAPSANVFMGISPTSADHIDPEILVEVDIILDGGPCEVGLESTVVDVSGGNPRVLRPGAVTRADIQAALGRPLGDMPPGDVRRSPGMYPRHYAPRATLRLVEKAPAGEPGLVFGEPQNENQVRMPRDPAAYGSGLYSALRRLDRAGHEVLFAELPPQSGDWEAVNDRLRKASGTA